MQALAQASGDITLKEQAAAFQANVQKMTTSLHTVVSASVELANQLSGQGYTDIVDFFSSGISGAKDFGTALSDLGSQFEGIVAKMISQLITYYALTTLIGWVAPNSSFLSSLQSSGPFGKGFAGGGYTGDVPANQIAGVVHGKEWVFDADTTAKNMELFQAIQNGQTPTIRPVSAAATSYSDAYASQASAGGSSGSGVDAPVPIVQVINNTGQKTTQKQTAGPGGQSITQIIIGAIATDIAGGGQVAKTMQTSYGLTRQGVKRG
jgi:hypothetical protein